mgnify:CR=1 FL=1
MLNESKVKLMTRMAMYESKQGEEDFKISSYYKKDYRSFHTIATIIWVTVGYAVAVGIGVIAFLDELMKNLNMQFAVIIGYLVLVIFYGIVASHFYGTKHEKARKRVKQFNHDLTRLNRMYEREKR